MYNVVRSIYIIIIERKRNRERESERVKRKNKGFNVSKRLESININILSLFFVSFLNTLLLLF